MKEEEKDRLILSMAKMLKKMVKKGTFSIIGPEDLEAMEKLANRAERKLRRVK